MGALCISFGRDHPSSVSVGQLTGSNRTLCLGHIYSYAHVPTTARKGLNGDFVDLVNQKRHRMGSRCEEILWH